jgi:hypothetical protein
MIAGHFKRHFRHCVSSPIGRKHNFFFGDYLSIKIGIQAIVTVLKVYELIPVTQIINGFTNLPNVEKPHPYLALCLSEILDYAVDSIPDYNASQRYNPIYQLSVRTCYLH